ncbi:hypothetical protein [Massilia sp. Root418]|jgi:hypothetical protein|uniref:hypothetical protein n=1 Tax=Massilia sp. Root418 TaxID=1736532 RepID=UPI001E65C035|nr:hypothetical protein [Massilia sp. Root418]
MNRYEGKPLLRLIECYALDSIGQLTEDQKSSLTEMEEKLSQTFDLKGTWKEILEKVMNFPENLPTQIRAIWASNLEIAARKGVSVDPNEFAMAFVDQNFG